MIRTYKGRKASIQCCVQYLLRLVFVVPGDWAGKGCAKQTSSYLVAGKGDLRGMTMARILEMKE
jgi:hypothetical protein